MGPAVTFSSESRNIEFSFEEICILNIIMKSISGERKTESEEIFCIHTTSKATGPQVCDSMVCDG